MGRYVYLAVLLLIVVLGAGLRMYHLTTVPTELIVDEIDLYNSAQSIAATGHDIDGARLPFLYSSFTRNPPLYAVAGYASSLVFGKTPFGLRFPAVLFGLASVVFMYGIAFELTRRRDIAVVAALLQATQPLFIQFSRIAWEPASELPFLLAALYVLLRAFRARERENAARTVSFKALSLAAVLLGLTCYTYMAGWFYAAVLGGAILAVHAWRSHSWRTRLNIAGACIICFLIASPALWMWFFDPSTTSRVGRMTTFAHGFSSQTLRIFAANYLAHFRWSYLVSTGDPRPGVTWRYLNGFGAFYGWVVPLAALGLAVASRYVRSRWALVWLWLWLVTYPLGGALTSEGGVGIPNAPRTLAGAPVFCILAAAGFAFLLDWAGSLRSVSVARIMKTIVGSSLAGACAVSVFIFCNFYFTRYVHQNSNAWDSGTRATFAEIRTRHGEYDRACFEVYPAWYGIDSYIRFYLSDATIQTIDNDTDPRCLQPGTLLVTDNDHQPHLPGFERISTIRDVDGSVFTIITARPRMRTAATRSIQ